MKMTVLALGMALMTSIGVGCYKSPGSAASPKNKGELVYLFCENRAVEGEATPQRVCWEPGANESAGSSVDKVVLYCENKPTGDPAKMEKNCQRIEGVECDVRAKTGTNIAELDCISSEDKKQREISDQYQLDRARRQSK
ncbi:MAG: hypothetical protein QNJ97_19530 [Myxococcota bacterium]|nr:hypothetical protein [Myxococcota bacterium]